VSLPVSADLLPLLTYGFVLGWSVAWPPGPINAELVRRGLARGFWPAYGLALGACSGDALWAILVVLGAGVLFAGPTAHLVLAVLSTVLLLVLAGLFLRGAWHGLRASREDVRPAPAGRFESRRAGYLLGLAMALTSPWNVAFWLAVIGRPAAVQGGLGASLVVALSVILGAAVWCLILCSAVVLLRVRFASAAWEVVAKGATGLLMLYFAVLGIVRLAGG
jgi:threonine/homoserine/homoserine lactone efflux protein